MDAMDEKIIEALKKNSRKSNVSIAKRLKTTEGTVRARIKSLRDEGVIREFTVKTASKNVKALIEVKIAINIQTADISSQIMRMREVESVFEVSGEVDIIAMVDVMSTKELNSVIERIRVLDSTISTKTLMILNEQ